MATTQILVTFITHRLPYPPNKGEKIRTFYQIKALVLNGFDVVVFSPVKTDAELRLAKKMEKLLAIKVHCFQLKSKITRLGLGLIAGQSLSQSNFHSKALRDELLRYVQKNVVHAFVGSASSMWPYLAILKKTSPRSAKYFVDLMDVDSDKWRQYSQSSSFPMKLLYKRESRLVTKLELDISRNSDACYLIAQAEVDLFKRFVDSESKVKVLGNGIDTKVFYPTPEKHNSEAFTMLFTGVMDYKPNVDAVVWFVENCWNDICARIPNAKFVIAGMNPNSEIKALNEKSGIEVTGMVDDILPYYHSANVFVAPFRLARGVQNKILQAFSCALPVVSTSMGAEGIACTNKKDILIANSAREVIKAIFALYESLDFRVSIGKSANELILQHYSWESQLKPLMNDLKIASK